MRARKERQRHIQLEGIAAPLGSPLVRLTALCSRRGPKPRQQLDDLVVGRDDGRYGTAKQYFA